RLYETEHGAWMPAPFGNGRMRAPADGNRLTGALQADLVNTGTVRATIGMPAIGTAGTASHQPLDGRLTLHLHDLAFVQGVVSDLESTHGALDADLAVRGTLGSPIIEGPLRLQNASTDVPRYGL